MNTQIASKLAAFAVAFMMNCLIVGAVAQLFDSRSTHPVVSSTIETAAAQPMYGAA